MFLKQLDLGTHFLLLFDIEGVPPRPKLVREFDFPFHRVNIACMEYNVKRPIKDDGWPLSLSRVNLKGVAALRLCSGQAIRPVLPGRDFHPTASFPFRERLVTFVFSRSRFLWRFPRRPHYRL